MTSTVVSTLQTTRPRWDEVDLVLLDMDGTLLDLQFDNYFWLELVPQRFAQLRNLSIEAAREQLTPRFVAKQGTLEWYCTDYWSRELSLDIAGMKREISQRIGFLPGAERFLSVLRARGTRLVLVTNAHNDSLAIKAEVTGLMRYLDAAISSHTYGAPKEHAEFWRRLQADLQFDPARALFVDDSLAVLRAARQHGIGQIFAIAHPDTTQQPRQVAEFPAVHGVIELL